MELSELLLSKCYQWDSRPAASEADIAALIEASRVPLPGDYLALLRLSNGGSAQISGYPNYVRIWPAKLAIENNKGYQVQKWLPGFIAFGDNGGPDMVGFDTRNGEPYPVCSIPFAPMEWEGAMGTVADFKTFIEQLLPGVPDADGDTDDNEDDNEDDADAE